jgi:hypothetical protein
MDKLKVYKMYNKGKDTTEYLVLSVTTQGRSTQGKDDNAMRLVAMQNLNMKKFELRELGDY